MVCLSEPASAGRPQHVCQPRNAVQQACDFCKRAGTASAAAVRLGVVATALQPMACDSNWCSGGLSTSGTGTASCMGHPSVVYSISRHTFFDTCNPFAMDLATSVLLLQAGQCAWVPSLPKDHHWQSPLGDSGLGLTTRGNCV